MNTVSPFFSRTWLCLLCLCAVTLAGCAADRRTASSDAPSPAVVAVAPTGTPAAPPTATSTATPTATPTETPTPLPTDTPTPFPFPPEFVQATALQALDGNTIEVQIGEEVRQLRYVLTQAPALEEPRGDVAQARNHELVTGQTVYLEKDRNETDRNGRLLRYVYLTDGRMVNEILVREGLAQVMSAGGDVKYEAELRMAQADAMIQGQGLWDGSRATANRNASLRSGPGTDFEVVGTAPVGETLDIVGRTENGAWYQLADGTWIARFMVDNAPLMLPVTTP